MLFASDVDNTLIRSYKYAKPGDICVEIKNGAQQSFMTPDAIPLLKEISEKCTFVPVTTRSLEQYLRINFGVTPKYAIVANGAMLLIDGKPDEQWIREIRETLRAELPNIAENELIYDIRQINECFISAKSNEPEQAVAYLQTQINADEYTVCSIRSKVYVFPIGINKGTAIDMLKTRIKPQKTICAGDSELDIPMLTKADIAIIPSTLNYHAQNALILNSESFPRDTLLTVRELLYSCA